MWCSTASSRFASDLVIAEGVAFVEACGLADDSGACAFATPNANVDTSTAMINFINFSVGIRAVRRQPSLLPVVRCGTRKRGPKRTVAQDLRRHSQTQAQSVMSMRLHNARRIPTKGVGTVVRWH